MDAAVGEPGPPGRADVPPGAGRGPRGLPGHRPGALPHRPTPASTGRCRASRARRSSRVATFPPPAPDLELKEDRCKFAKAHGLGNDFILVAEKDAPGRAIGVDAEAVRPSPGYRGRRRGAPLPGPRTGCGCCCSTPTGFPGDISGNGLRCLAALAVRHGWAAAEHTVHTVVGPRAVQVRPPVPRPTASPPTWGSPGLASSQVPIDLDPPQEPVVGVPGGGAGPYRARDRDVDGQPPLRRLPRRAGGRRPGDHPRPGPGEPPPLSRADQRRVHHRGEPERDPRALLGARGRAPPRPRAPARPARSWPRSSTATPTARSGRSATGESSRSAGPRAAPSARSAKWRSSTKGTGWEVGDELLAGVARRRF